MPWRGGVVVWCWRAPQLPPNDLNVTKRRSCKQVTRDGRRYLPGWLTAAISGGRQAGVIRQGGGRQQLGAVTDKISQSNGHPRRWHTIKMENPIHPELPPFRDAVVAGRGAGLVLQEEGAEGGGVQAGLWLEIKSDGVNL
ncbi:hypothetical protein E2C01_039953 [Portunus trituberculatus]|uniref:Uncharacterized protein n=1 Tax=Portunus trituberculatus TaxID=210409 RepID=A0A5B7FMM8_PORTR|nr:hypothetical protein [Portunus trituberculatus]